MCYDMVHFAIKPAFYLEFMSRFAYSADQCDLLKVAVGIKEYRFNHFLTRVVSYQHGFICGCTQGRNDIKESN